MKALLRIAVVWNVPIACNRASADFMISSTLMTGEYERLVVDYEPYRERQVEALVSDKMDELGHNLTLASTSNDDTTSSAAGV